MALHQHRRQDTAAGRAKKRRNAAPTARAARRQDTVAGRAIKRRNKR